MHRRKVLLRIAVLALVSTLAALALPGPVLADGTKLSTDMSGAEEAPAPGDDDATGTAHLTLNQGTGTVCYDLSWANIDGTVTAAHIHRGPAGQAGPVVVPLFVGQSFAGTGSDSGCVTSDRALIKDIRKNPTAYYVNVHSTTFPAGAIRGQLGD
jgi:CHRD domain-containing protein